MSDTDDLLALLDAIQARNDYETLCRALRRARRRLGITDRSTVHHLDGNPYNNDPSNLVIVNPKENGE